DARFYDGVGEALTEADLRPNAMVLRIVRDVDSCRAQLGELLAMENRPTGLIVRSLRLAEIIAETICEHGLDMGRDIEIVFDDQMVSQSQRAPYPHSLPKMSFAEIADRLGEMLSDLAESRELETPHVLVPVEFHIPK
ncbi:MAG: substrate-binding domain-containing protein, partial [Pirellulales bacterium]|nr:substrate-binding domain-containing protein [Pirellulales bacterium]